MSAFEPDNSAGFVLRVQEVGPAKSGPSKTVRGEITAPFALQSSDYGRIIQDEPLAVLSYTDRDRDLITVGSSAEFTDCTNEWDERSLREPNHLRNPAPIFDSRGGSIGFGIWRGLANQQSFGSDSGNKATLLTASSTRSEKSVKEEPLSSQHTDQLTYQRSLWESFNVAQNAKQSENSDYRPGLEQRSPDAPNATSNSEPSEPSARTPLPDHGIPEILRSIVLRLDQLGDELTREVDRLGISQAFSHHVPEAVNRIMDGLNLCVSNAAQTAQQASAISRHAAEATCRLDLSHLENALNGARSAIESVGDVLSPSSQPESSIRSDSQGVRGPGSVENTIRTEHSATPRDAQSSRSLLDDPIPAIYSDPLSPTACQPRAHARSSFPHSPPLRILERNNLVQPEVLEPTRRRSVRFAAPLTSTTQSPDAAINRANNESFSRRDGTSSLSSRTVPGAWPSSTNAYASMQSSVDDSPIDHCAMQLLEMGFGGDLPGSIDHLKILARAAEGNIEKAIDLINNEQQRWDDFTRRHH